MRRKSLLGICMMLALAGANLFAADPRPPTKANISYGAHPHQLLDIYLPPQGKGPFPVVIWYGALWKAGKGVPDLNHFFPFQCAAIGVEMRTMTDAAQDKVQPPISYCMLDARRALQYVRLHAADWNLDPSRIAVAGASQGSLPALYVGCAGEQANPKSVDPVERISTKVLCVGAWISQCSLDPKQIQEWVPGIKAGFGAPAWGCNFEESLRRRAELLPVINKWSPDKLLSKDDPPIYFGYMWGLTKPGEIKETPYLVHSPKWGLGFQKLAQKRGVACYVNFPDHPSEKYDDIWDFLVKQMSPVSKGR